MIVLTGVTKSFGRRTVLKDVALTIEPGELICLIGKSGAGKSTLLHLLLGAETPTSGKIEVDGVDLRNVPPMALQLYRRRVGMVFQDYKLLGNRTVAENITFPLEVCGVEDAVIVKRVQELLRDLDLTQLADAMPRELSGGEQARAAIGRAIAHKPMILLADEPTGNLDADQSAQILQVFRDIHAAGTSVILATHDMPLVEGLKARVLRLENGVLLEQKHHRTPHAVHAVHRTTHRAKEKETGETAEQKPRRKVKITSIGG